MSDQPPKPGLSKAQRRKLFVIVALTDLLVVGAMLYYFFMVRSPATP